jgi:hypothetical protein
MPSFVTLVWRLVLIAATCRAAVPNSHHATPGDVLDGVPNLVAAATETLAGKMSGLLSSSQEASRFSALRHAAVPSAAVHTDLATAIGRLQKSLKATSESIKQWAKADEMRISSNSAKATAEYKRQHAKAIHERQALDSFLHASHEREAPILLKLDKLEGTRQDLEAEVLQEQNRLEAERRSRMKRFKKALQNKQVEWRTKKNSSHPMASSKATALRTNVSHLPAAKAESKIEKIGAAVRVLAKKITPSKMQTIRAPRAQTSTASSSHTGHQSGEIVRDIEADFHRYLIEPDDVRDRRPHKIKNHTKMHAMPSNSASTTETIEFKPKHFNMSTNLKGYLAGGN